MNRLIALCLVALLTACASAGREVKQADLQGFERGKTTVAQVEQRLGKPTQRTTTASGQMLSYAFFHSQARPETFIPIVGAFVGGADSRNSVTTLTFDQAGVLLDFTHSEGAIGAGTGVGAGTHQPPDRSQPAAVP